ncbi:MAG: hypothetical protein PHS14_00415 [Elusimicrobia bacterium]|nr:hypothetical protein [Elusimicrobiota bacterium]
MTTDTKIHLFERAGLGRAPFKLVDIVIRVGPYPLGNGSYVGAPGQPVGSCKYCGEGIATCCVIEDADGRRFDVGNICVYKHGDVGLVAKTKKLIAKKNTEARHAREVKKIDWATAKLPEVVGRWKADPHPYKDMAERGRTLWDWAQWMMANAGNRGKLQVAKLLEKTLNERAL